MERSGETKRSEPLVRGDDGVGSGQRFVAHPGSIPAAGGPRPAAGIQISNRNHGR
jgi:hypothetical protein